MTVDLPNRLIFNKDLMTSVLGQDKIVLIDAGARGELVEPWCYVNRENLKVIGFEPDKKEVEHLNSLNNNFKFFDYALWSDNSEIDLYIAKDLSTSSVYPPNMNLIKQYQSKHWKPRITEKVKKVKSTTIDTCIRKENISPDFLKIDVHSAELAVLKGAIETLRKDISGVLVETWTTEVHKGQPLTADILKFLTDLNFELFNVGVAAGWYRNNINHLEVKGKRQVVGLDLLFFKNLENRNSTSATKLFKNAAVAEVYGYPDYALNIIRQIKNDSLVSKVSQKLFNNWKKEGILKRYFNKVLNILLKREKFIYPKLR